MKQHQVVLSMTLKMISHTDMVARNGHTGDKIQTKETTKEYRDGWDAIFGKAGYGKCPAQGSPCACTGECKQPKEEVPYKPS